MHERDKYDKTRGYGIYYQCVSEGFREYIKKMRRKFMKRRLIQDEDGIYMIDEDCIRRKEEQERQKEMRWQKQKNRNGLPVQQKRTSGKHTAK